MFEGLFECVVLSFRVSTGWVCDVIFPYDLQLYCFTKPMTVWV